MTIPQSSPATAAPTLRPAELEQLAGQMLARVNGRGRQLGKNAGGQNGGGQYARVKLVSGLDVILQRMDALRWRLALAREDEFPSGEEVDAWRELLGTPPGAEPQRTFKRYHHPKSGRVILYHVVELTWLEYNREGAR